MLSQDWIHSNVNVMNGDCDVIMNTHTTSYFFVIMSNLFLSSSIFVLQLALLRSPPPLEGSSEWVDTTTIPSVTSSVRPHPPQLALKNPHKKSPECNLFVVSTLASNATIHDRCVLIGPNISQSDTSKQSSLLNFLPTSWFGDFSTYLMTSQRIPYTNMMINDNKLQSSCLLSPFLSYYCCQSSLL